MDLRLDSSKTQDLPENGRAGNDDDSDDDDDVLYAGARGGSINSAGTVTNKPAFRFTMGSSSGGGGGDGGRGGVPGGYGAKMAINMNVVTSRP